MRSRLRSTDERLLRRVAWVVWSAGLTALLLDVAAAGWVSGWSMGASDAGGLFYLALVYSFVTVGLVVLLRQPRHRLGWFLLVVLNAGIAIPTLLDAYALLGLRIAPGTWPAAGAVAAFNQGAWVLSIGPIAVFVVLLFPDGRLPTRRWRWLARLGAADIVVIALSIGLSPGRISSGTGQGLVSPIGLASLEVPVLVVFGVSLALLPVCVLSAAVAMVLRFRRSHGVERLQMKWFATAAALVATCYLVGMVAQLFKPTPFEGPDPQWLLVLQNLTTASFVSLPIAIGASILRHRLYDIDVVIKRTLVYGSLTVGLGLTYLVLVLALRAIPGSLVGDSDLAVAVSTLAVAALFRPLRRRIQAGVDRRFFRRAYDASQTADAFSDRLRQRVDLTSVSDDLRAVVAETLQPAGVSLWLREREAR